jgi:hypothetical protein
MKFIAANIDGLHVGITDFDALLVGSALDYTNR